jgi:hypothetical protein
LSALLPLSAGQQPTFAETNAAEKFRQTNLLGVQGGLPLKIPALENTMATEHTIRRETAHKLARFALFSFIVTFVLSRVFVFLIMADEMPNLYFFVRGTHVHHLNYGIFLMATVCGYSVFRRPTGRKAEITALLYGVAMGLTFDEFGMWLHLGGSYWQRASVDAIIVVAAVLAFIAYAAAIRSFESRHVKAFIALLIALTVFSVVLYDTSLRIGRVEGPRLEALEASSSP